MKSTIAHHVSCIGVLVFFVGYGKATAAPIPKTPISHPASTSAATHKSTAAHALGLLSKPAPYSQINPANALSEGLVSLVALTEGSGNAFYDAATGQIYHAVALSGTPHGALPPTWFAPNLTVDYPWEGPALSNNGAQALAIESNLPPSRFVTASSTGYSYAVLLQPLDTTTFGRTMDGTGNAVMTIYLNIARAPGYVTTTWANAAGTAINPMYKFTPDKWILVLCTVQQGLGVMYVNGVEVAHDTTVNLVRSASKQTGGLVFNTTGSGGYMMNANFSSWWVWNNRVLTAQEAAEMYESPWSMLK